MSMPSPRSNGNASRGWWANVGSISSASRGSATQA
jgi:hypothetical protein